MRAINLHLLFIALRSKLFYTLLGLFGQLLIQRTFSHVKAIEIKLLWCIYFCCRDLYISSLNAVSPSWSAQMLKRSFLPFIRCLRNFKRDERCSYVGHKGKIQIELRDDMNFFFLDIKRMFLNDDDHVLDNNLVRNFYFFTFLLNALLITTKGICFVMKII